MINPHPPLSGIPGALALVLFVYELSRGALRDASITEIRQADTRPFLLFCLAVSVLATYISGYFGAAIASESGARFVVEPSAIEFHRGIAKLTLVALFPMALFGFLYHGDRRNGVLRIVYLSLLGLYLGLNLWTAYHGGRLVFEHGAAVVAIPS